MVTADEPLTPALSDSRLEQLARRLLDGSPLHRSNRVDAARAAPLGVNFPESQPCSGATRELCDQADDGGFWESDAPESLRTLALGNDGAA